MQVEFSGLSLPNLEDVKRLKESIFSNFLGLEDSFNLFLKNGYKL